VGKHGLYIESGGLWGVFLPQVAPEHGWDIGKFLQETGRKAGLKKSGWQDPAPLISSFTALLIEEGP
jgi:uncharacterized protein